MDLQQQIEEHERQILGRVSKCYRDTCPHCGGSFAFARRGFRRRKFYAFSGQTADAAQSWLVRWRCSNCRRSFTDYPPFAIPYKRHTKRTIFDRAIEYCSQPRSTYRSVTGTPDSTGRKPAESGCAPSSVWRWLSWFSRLWQSANKALRWIDNQDPTTTLHRKPWMVDPWKYHSDARRLTVQLGYRSVGIFSAFEAFALGGPSPTLQHRSG